MKEAKLDLKPASSIQDFMLIRKIRNSCREYMTRDKGYIGIWQQLAFFVRYHTSDRANVAFIGYNEKHMPVAYGLITYDDRLLPWVSGGILPAHRGRGYGTHLFRFLSTEWHMPVYLEVLESNAYALKLYTGLGFREIDRKHIADTMKNGAVRMETVITMKKAAE